jgi:hypothetical protein
MKKNTIQLRDIRDETYLTLRDNEYRDAFCWGRIMFVEIKSIDLITQSVSGRVIQLFSIYPPPTASYHLMKTSHRRRLLFLSTFPAS